jgi:hypothetical protein
MIARAPGAAAQVGMVLSPEVSRLARNNTDWYRLLGLAGMTDTLIADADGVSSRLVVDPGVGLWRLGVFPD